VSTESADPLSLYRAARESGSVPALLESLGPPTSFGRLTLLGVGRRRRLELWGGVLYDDGRPAGGVDELFGVLEAAQNDSPCGRSPRRPSGRPRFFPAWIGFFSYEFARHLGLPTREPMPGLPDAAFFWYPEGYAWLKGELVEQPAAEFARAEGAGDDASRPPIAGAPVVSVEIESDYEADDFLSGVEDVQERIRAGWVYQVNLSHRFHFAARGLDPLALYERLRRVNPSPFMGVLEGDGWTVVSGSPERLFNRVDEVMTARPIAGTRPRARRERGRRVRGRGARSRGGRRRRARGRATRRPQGASRARDARRPAA